MISKRLLRARNRQISAEVENDLAGNPLQYPIRDGRGQNLTCLDDEQIVRGALGHVSDVIEHDRLGDARIRRFDLGQNTIQIIQAFYPSGHSAGMVSDIGGGDHRHSLLVHIPGIHLDRVGNDKNRR